MGGSGWSASQSQCVATTVGMAEIKADSCPIQMKRSSETGAFQPCRLSWLVQLVTKAKRRPQFWAQVTCPARESHVPFHPLSDRKIYRNPWSTDFPVDFPFKYSRCSKLGLFSIYGGWFQGATLPGLDPWIFRIPQCLAVEELDPLIISDFGEAVQSYVQPRIRGNSRGKPCYVCGSWLGAHYETLNVFWWRVELLRQDTVLSFRGRRGKSKGYERFNQHRSVLAQRQWIIENCKGFEFRMCFGRNQNIFQKGHQKRWSDVSQNQELHKKLPRRSPCKSQFKLTLKKNWKEINHNIFCGN